MPNWCMQELVVKGKYNALDEFIRTAKSKKSCLDVENFIPMPKSLREATSGSEDVLYDIWYGDISVVDGYQWIPKGIKGNREKLKTFFRKQYPDADKKADQYKHNVDTYGHKTWYSWAIASWGTKWGICNPILEERPRSLLYTFESAWSPVVPVVLKMSNLFPELTFSLKYWEEGCGFEGKVILKNGAILTDEHKNSFGGY